MILERMRKTSNEKAIKDVEKQLAKGKVSDKARSEISEFYRTNRQKVVAIEDSISRLEALKKKEGVIACMRKSFPEKSKTIPVRMLTFTDTILNTSWRPAIFLKSSEVASDFSDASKGWEWLKQESSQYKDESYPVDVSYYYYPSHPEFKVKEEHSWRDPEYVVYDAKGSLVAIPMFRRGVLRMAVEPLKLKIQAYAYNNNDLNIQSDDAHAKHYVKVQTGLEKLTAKEKQASERAQTQLANAILGSMRADMKYGSNSRKAKAIGRKNAGKAVAALGSSDFYDDKGYRWLDEIEKIYDAKLASPYSFERVDDTTFRSIYVDRNGNGLFEVIVKYVTDGEPFTYKEQFTVNSLAGQHFFTSEEVGQYNDLISRCGSAKNASEIN